MWQPNVPVLDDATIHAFDARRRRESCEWGFAESPGGANSFARASTRSKWPSDWYARRLAELNGSPDWYARRRAELKASETTLDLPGAELQRDAATAMR